MPMIRLLFIAFVLSLAACATNSGRSGQYSRLYSGPVLLHQIPFFPQQDYQCGPAALATVLGASGLAVQPEQLVEAVFIPSRRGSLQIEMVAAARAHGRLVYQIDPDLNAILTEVNAGSPVLVMQNLGLSWFPQWHYAVVTGFDLARGTLILNSGTIESYQMPLKVFEKTWTRADNWGLVVFEAGQLPQQADENRYFETSVAFETTSGSAAAIPAYEAGLERWPQSRLINAALGNSYYNLGHLDKAIAQFQNLLTLHPDFADGHNNLAFLLSQLGDHESARIHAERAINIGGNRSQFYEQTLQQIETEISL